MSPISPNQLAEYAERLELDFAVLQLLKERFPDRDWEQLHPGRYRLLGQILNRHSNLVVELKNHLPEPKTLRKIWRELVEAETENIQFLHWIAVIYHEQALLYVDDGEAGAKAYWPPCTALWSLLLSTDTFWDYFSQNRVTDRETGERFPLDLDAQTVLMREWLNEMLSLHSTVAVRAFLAGNLPIAGIHLRCLDLCRKGESAFRDILEEHGIPFRLNPLEKRLLIIQGAAEETLDDVGNILVREASKISEDIETIKHLPQGIRKNYNGGIKYLSKFIKLDIPVNRVLRQCLEWYNEWCYDLYVTEQISRIQELITNANDVAEQLIPLSTKGAGLRPENQAISQHFLFRGFIEQDPEKALKEFEEAIAWNPHNENARQLLGGRYREIIMKQLEHVVERVERHDFTSAYEILDAISEQLEDQDIAEKDQIIEARALVYFRHAEQLANDGRFRDALRRAREADKLVPNQPSIMQLVKEMEEYAPEENNLRFLREAREALEKNLFDSAIKKAAQVSEKSRFAKNARRVQSSAYFHWAITLANEEQDFEKAYEYMNQALEVNDFEEDRKIILEQLGQLRRAMIWSKVQDACEQGRWETAENILRKELKELPKHDKKNEYGIFLRKNLSAILNAHAVSILNEGYKNDQKFIEAFNDIMNQVKQYMEGR
ncbi:MAG: hypothetical protein D6732_25885 [Methanobacteriota archaeon]|nr:MAG: hypothetical protein D6732_25885 [Euryarchaeota archaeon]